MMNYLFRYFLASGTEIAKSDDVGLVLRAHLLAELLMDSILKKNTRNHRLIKRRDLHFSMKLAVVDSFGLIPEKTVHALETLNVIRNKFAHDVRMKLKNLDLSGLDQRPVEEFERKALKRAVRQLRSKEAVKRIIFANLMGGWLTSLARQAFGPKNSGVGR